MKHIEKYLLLTVLFFSVSCLATQPCVGQAKVVASASKRVISNDEFVTLQFNVENTKDIEQFIPPSFSGCKIMEGPMHVAGSSTINGVQSNYISFVYIIQPRLPGRYSFSGASAKVNGKRLVFNTVNIDVTEGQGSSGLYNFQKNSRERYSPPEEELYSDYILRKGENLRDKIRKNLFIKVDVNKTSCYEGEPVVASYKLYTRLRSESKVSRRPSFNGFSVYDMVDPSVQPSAIEKLNGKDFNVYLIRKAQLFPLQSGTLELDPAEVENDITFLKAEYAMKDKGEHLPDLLRSFEADDIYHEGIKAEKVNIRSNPVAVTVKALPDLSKPASFDGAVGKFSIEAAVDKKELQLNDAAVLKVIIKGEGNFGIINAPVIKWPKDVEVYEPSAKEDFLKSMVPLRGYKTFQYTFMPKKAGATTIPGIEFSYFNPKEHKYETVVTDSVRIHTTGSANNMDKAGFAAEGIYTAANNGINRSWILGTAAVLLAIFGFILFRYIRGGSNHVKFAIQQAPSSLQAPAMPAEKSVQDELVSAHTPDPLFNARLMLIQQNSSGFYSELSKTIKDFSAEKLGIKTTNPGKQAIEQALKAQGFDDIMISQFQLLLQQCEVALYTPSLNDLDMQSAYDLADDFIQQMNTKET
ncbi:MAG: protein BatD [Chitinophagaceae bacterium]|nr:protein BatD [Chitinophagaceae bacterium]